MGDYRIQVKVEHIKGKCPVYKPGDTIIIDKFYINTSKSANVCIHAFGALLSLLSAFIHGSSAKELGIGKEHDIGYLQCPDPGPPITCGGTVTFKLIREKLED